MKKLKAGQFYGTTSQTLAADSFRFTEKTYSSSARLPAHAHELAHFCFVLAGNYGEQIGSKTFERKPLALVFYPPEISHSEQHLADGRHLLIEIDGKGLGKIREYGAQLDEPVFLQTQDSLALAAKMYGEFCERDAFSPLALENIATELLIAASRRQTFAERNPPRWLKVVKEYLHENFYAPPGLSQLAEAVGVHPTHLARVFRRFEGCTVGEYVRKIRIDEARRKILHSEESLVEIALEAGFADQTHFSRSFKKMTGMTPGEFRKFFRAR